MKHVSAYDKQFPDWEQKDVENVMDMYLRENDMDSWHNINEEIMDTDPQIAEYQYQIWKKVVVVASVCFGRLVYMATLKTLEKSFK